MIKIEEATKSYGRGENIIHAVYEASLDVEAGEFVVITGHSGSGKTTLLNLVGGMTRPDQGRIEVAGADILSMTDAEISRFRARTIGFIFQFMSMLAPLNVIDNVRLPLAFTGRVDKEGRYTWQEMERHLANNWAGPEGERARLAMSTVPHFASGGSLADEYAQRISQLRCARMM